MADINISFTNATPQELRAANYVLERTNAGRVERGLPEFANVKDMIKSEIIDRLIPRWIRMQADADEEGANLKTKYRNAPKDIRAQIKILLDSVET
jgi:hypothetical protein